MPSITLDDLTAPGLWEALAPDGVTPSTELSIALDTTQAPPGNDVSSARISGSIDALNNTLFRNLGPVDLTQSDEIRLWILSSRVADGSPSRPFFLEMRLGSAALAINAPTNLWQRYLPVSQIGQWEPIRLTLADLPAAVRGSLSTIQLRCSDASSAFNSNIDAIIAVRDAMIGDVDLALQVMLDGVLSVGGVPIPAVLHPANGPQTQAPPYIEILNYDVIYSRERTETARPRGDFTDQGSTLRPPSNAYEIYYQVAAVANDRPTQSAMLEFVLRALPPRGLLAVNGYPLPMESVFVQPIDRLGGFRTDQIPLYYKISARQEVGLGNLVLPVKAVSVNTDLPS